MAAVSAAVAMPFPWHHRIAPGPIARIEVVRGIDGASWLIVIAAVCLLFAARFVMRRPGFYVKWALTITAFVALLGVCADYIDDQARAGEINSAAYSGPGFYLGVAVVPIVIAAVVVAWRNADPL